MQLLWSLVKALLRHMPVWGGCVGQTLVQTRASLGKRQKVPKHSGLNGWATQFPEIEILTWKLSFHYCTWMDLQWKLG